MTKYSSGLILAFAIAAALEISGGARAPSKLGIEREAAQDHCQWVAKALEEMETIRPGMTRADLLKVFTIEGGLSTPLHRAYVYRGCPNIKVDVEFRAVGRPERDPQGRVTLVESDLDQIVSISRPYLARPILD